MNNKKKHVKYKCDVCKKKLKKPYRLAGYILCSKHMHQYHKYHKFLDNIPRTQNDLNDFVIKGDDVIINLYSGKTSEKIAEFIIDKEDLSKVQYHKWRLSHNHVVTGCSYNNTQRELSWVILGLDNRDESTKNIVVDYIDGNPLNNRKINLRICKQAQNTLNKSFMSNKTSGFIGVSYRRKRNTYDPEIRFNGIRCHLGQTKTLEEAVYKRLLAEDFLFKEYTNNKRYKFMREFTNNRLTDEQKYELRKIVIKKLKKKNLWYYDY
jgi:hypothetical protein